jgi:hypothetical protein
MRLDCTTRPPVTVPRKDAVAMLDDRDEATHPTSHQEWYTLIFIFGWRRLKKESLACDVKSKKPMRSLKFQSRESGVENGAFCLDFSRLRLSPHGTFSESLRH